MEGGTVRIRYRTVMSRYVTDRGGVFHFHVRIQSSIPRLLVGHTTLSHCLSPLLASTPRNWAQDRSKLPCYRYRAEPGRRICPEGSRYKPTGIAALIGVKVAKNKIKNNGACPALDLGEGRDQDPTPKYPSLPLEAASS
jgi:hypothetical protein